MATQRLIPLYGIHLVQTLPKRGKRVYKVMDDDGQQFVLQVFGADVAGVKNPYEISIPSTVSHPNILRIKSISGLGVYSDEGVSVLYDVGTPLLEWIENDWNLEGAYRHTVGLARGLAFLHGRRFIHLGVDTDNIVIIDGKLKLGGFSQSMMTYNGRDVQYADRSIKSKYAALEILTFGDPGWQPYGDAPPITNKLDIWPFGLVLIAIMTTTYPFNEELYKTNADKDRYIGESRGQWYDDVFSLIEDGEFDDDMKERLLKVVKGCLRSNPKDRISMEEVLRIMGEEQVEASITVVRSNGPVSTVGIDVINRLAANTMSTLSIAVLVIAIELYYRAVPFFNDLDCDSEEDVCKRIGAVCLWIAYKLDHMTSSAGYNVIFRHLVDGSSGSMIPFNEMESYIITALNGDLVPSGLYASMRTTGDVAYFIRNIALNPDAYAEFDYSGIWRKRIRGKLLPRRISSVLGVDSKSPKGYHIKTVPFRSYILWEIGSASKRDHQKYKDRMPYFYPV